MNVTVANNYKCCSLQIGENFESQYRSMADITISFRVEISDHEDYEFYPYFCDEFRVYADFKSASSSNKEDTLNI